MKTKEREKTEWGSVEWIHLQKKNESNMSVGLVSMDPRTHAKRHIHYGQEQMLYVLEGEGYYIINDEKVEFGAGDCFVMPADCSHETFNTGDSTVTELLVSVPTGRTEVKAGRTDDTFDEKVDPKEMNLLYRSAEGLRDSLRQKSNLPYTVFDATGRPVMQSNGFPDVCKMNCDPVNRTDECECFCCDFGECDTEDGWISNTCSHGMKIFLCPVSYNGKLIGMVRGGHFFTSEKGAQNEGADYDVPKTAQIAIHSVLEQVVDLIERYISYLASIEDLRSKEEKLNETITANQELKQDLSEVNEKVTNLKINHHFLFNTLNCMSAMALEGDKMDMYQSVIDLSKLFRYTMTTEIKMTTLAKELDYLKSYLNLQKLRYKDGLAVSYDIEEACLDVMVPFNFLQPIVENAFTHGFMSYDYDKDVRIMIAMENDDVVIRMFNNGILPAAADLNLIMESWSSGNGHGLSLIYDKLRACYAERFSMEIDTPGMEGTQVTVRIPASSGTP